MTSGARRMWGEVVMSSLKGLAAEYKRKRCNGGGAWKMAVMREEILCGWEGNITPQAHLT